MAHFAKLDENNNVIAVHVVNNDVITIDGNESEQLGIDFLTQLHNYPLWKQTSYNAAINGFRKKYAAIGMTYSLIYDAFILPKPFNSWIFDKEKCDWIAPKEYPVDGKNYIWDEMSLSWFEII
jgi:hypothetical protein